MECLYKQGVVDQASNEIVKEDILRVAFVEMLFALVVADVAVHAAELAQAPGNLWPDKLPAISHLVLALMLIATSWVGWRQSPSPGMKDRVKTVVSWQFASLLLDVLIVIFYYVLTRWVEVKTESDKPVLKAPDAQPEAVWLFCIFVTYAIWDLVADIFPPGYVPNEASWWRAWRRWIVMAKAVPLSVLSSVVCALLSGYVYMQAASGDPPQKVIALDVALISVVVLFRLIKLSETWFAGKLHIRHLQAFEKAREVQRRHYITFVIFVAIYIAALMAAG